jgi:hypothetical protein
MGNRIVAAGFCLMTAALLGSIASCSVSQRMTAGHHGSGDPEISGARRDGDELVFDAPLCASNYFYIQEPAQAPNGVDTKGNLVWHGPIRALMFLHGCGKEAAGKAGSLPSGTIEIHGNVFAAEFLHKAEQ